VGRLLRIKSEFPCASGQAAQTYYRWVRQSIRENSLRQFVRDCWSAREQFPRRRHQLLRANPIKDPQTIAESTAIIFMGVRLGCARCTDIPPRTGPSTITGSGGFFSKVAFKPTQEWKEECVCQPQGCLRHPRTKEIVKPKYFGGEALDVPEQDDPAGKVRRLAHPAGKPYFVKNSSTRLVVVPGAGIIHEPDDLRPTNPPSNPNCLRSWKKTSSSTSTTSGTCSS